MSPVLDLVAGSAAGATAVLLTYPLDLVCLARHHRLSLFHSLSSRLYQHIHDTAHFLDFRPLNAVATARGDRCLPVTT